MGKLAMAAALILLGGPESEWDILYLKDGREIEGFIVSETEQLIKIAVLGKGSKGETGGLMSVGYRVDQIARIQRMSSAKRDLLIRKYQGFRERRSRKAEAQSKIQTRRVSLQGERALRARGTHFEVFGGSVPEPGVVLLAASEFNMDWDDLFFPGDINRYPSAVF